MAEVTNEARRRGKDASDQVSEVEDEARDGANGGERAGDGSPRTITSELKDTFREAAIEVLKPVIRKATTSAAKYAVTEGPSLVKDKVAPKVADAGGPGAIAKGVASKGGGIASGIGGKLSGKKEDKSPSGTGRGRRLPVQEHVDVGVDLETAYDQFTQFEDWPRFMHRVERIEQRDDTTLMWHENIWGVRRSWEAEITEQVPCERIVWRGKNGPQTLGVVTFHRLSDQLTRIAITMDFQPKGLFEKTSSGMRISRRALKSDLMRLKAFIELRDEATGGWRGRIEEGDVVDSEHEEPRGSAEEDEAREQEEEEEYEEEEEEDEEEPRASEEEEDEEDREPEEDEAQEPQGRRDRRFKRREDEAPKPHRRRRTAASKD